MFVAPGTATDLEVKRLPDDVDKLWAGGPSPAATGQGGVAAAGS